MQQRLTLMKPSHPHHQRGITLIESLVAILVAALGILGILGVQMRTLADTSTTVRRAQAIRLIEDLGERLKVNPNALMSLDTAYVAGFGAPAPTPGARCPSGSGCDLASWQQTVTQTLPGGQASTFIAPAEAGAATNRRQLGVMISWRENEREGITATDQQQADATQVRASDGTLSAGTDTANACPAGRTCHLQYLPVSARCAPDFRSGAAQYFCPGP